MKGDSRTRNTIIFLIILIIGPINLILSKSFLYYHTNINESLQNNSEPDIAYTGTIGTLAWSVSHGLGLYYTPAIGDVDNDGYTEILTIEDSGLKCLNGINGDIEWETNNLIDVGGIVIYDVDSDGGKEIIVGGSNNLLFCLSGNSGNIEWTWTPGYEIGYGMPSIGDVDNDGNIDILMRGRENPQNFTCFSSDGEVKWQIPNFSGDQNTGQVCADIDNDNKNEILIGGTNGNFYCLSGVDGTVEWAYPTGNSRFSVPAIGDVDNDNELEVVVGSDDGKIYCFSKNGALEWSYQTLGYIYASPILIDINNDEYLEVVIGSRDNSLYCISGYSGSFLWDFASTGEIDATAAAADIDNDGYIEIIFGSKNGTLYCLSSYNGVMEWSYNAGDSIEASPMIGDVDNDGKLEIIFGSTNGTLNCLIASGYSYRIPSPWPCYGGSTWHTGYYIDDDGDGIPTPLEKSISLNPDLSDSDFDGLNDRDEIESYNTNPLNLDTDSDGMTDGWEVDNSLNPNLDTDAENDDDNDLLINLEEFNLETDPQNNDTDGDGLIDGDEVLTYETDPLDEDTDNDHYSDGEEIDAGTDPLDPNSYPAGKDKSFLDEYLIFILIGLIIGLGIMGVVVGIIIVKPKFLEQKQIKNKIIKIKENIESFEHEFVSFIIDKLKNQYSENWWDLGIPEGVKKELDDKVIKKKGD